MSTAITSSAPIWRAKRTGTGATRPPSTYSRAPMRTGWNTAGTALEARTATPGSPTLEQDGLAAVEVGGDDAQRQLHLLDAAPAGVLAHVARQRLAADQPAAGERPVGDGRSRPSTAASVASSAPLLPDAYSAATRLPAEVPTTRSGRMPASSSTWITPMWAKPRAAPPPSARPMPGGLARRLGWRGRRHAARPAAAGGGVWHAARQQPAPARQTRQRGGSRRPGSSCESRERRLHVDRQYSP